VSYSAANFSNLLSLYFVQNSGTIIGFTAGARNAGDRSVLRLDYHMQGIIPGAPGKQLKAWAYYSTILREEEQKFGSDGSRIGKGEIGDLAHQKVYFGVNWRVNTNLNALLRGRFIGNRTPIDANPFDVIGGYFTMDLNLRYENLFAPGVTVGLKVVNLLDRKYYHPGIREANSGDPDTFAADQSAIGWSGKAWNGSNG
jgi:outer membrane receptor for ferrienterochelin and colicins